MDVTRYATSGWKVSRIVGPMASDGWYGLGGVSFKADAHALARWGTAPKAISGETSRASSSPHVEQPGGGRIQIRLDKKDLEVLDTSGPEEARACLRDR